MEVFHFLSIILGLLYVQAANRDRDIGLGIALSTAYANIRAVRGDDTYIDIAKIEGGESYKAYMLGTQQRSDDLVSTAIYCPFSDRICHQYWPLRSAQPQNLLTPILRALIAAAEATLETRVTSAVVSVYDFRTINPEATKQHIHSAISISTWNRLDHTVRHIIPASGPSEEKALVKFLLQLSDLGSPVRIKYLPSLAFRIARQRCAAHQPSKPPGKNWARGFEKRHRELQARRVRAIDWNRHDNNIHSKIVEWFEVIKNVLQDPAVLCENVHNMDETGVMLSVLGSVKVLMSKNDPRDYRGAGVKRTMVTAIEFVSADGRSLLSLIIWPAATHRANWTTHPTPGWHYAHSETGYNDSLISLEWITRVFDPQTKARAGYKPRVLICDGFGTHESLEILEFCFANNIILCRLPSHTSHKLQPCDVGLFGPLKGADRDQVERLYRGGVDTVRKEYFTSLYSAARQFALTTKNIKAAWAATGLYPFDPDRVLRNTPKPVSNTVSQDCEPDRETYPHSEVVQPPATPATPVTPMTSEALSSMHNQIAKDARDLEEPSKQRLERHVQKLTNAARISFAESALLRDQNRFLYNLNNEAKVRRSTKRAVVGKAKVMSYEDIEEARAKRAAKEEAKVATKGKRGRKRKIPASTVEVAPPRLTALIAKMV